MINKKFILGGLMGLGGMVISGCGESKNGDMMNIIMGNDVKVIGAYGAEKKSGALSLEEALKSREGDPLGNIKRIKQREKILEKRQLLRVSCGDGFFQRIWVDYDVFIKGVSGMKIYSDFVVKGMKGRDFRVNAYFYHKNGGMLVNMNRYYCSPDGQVFSQGKISVPKSEEESYRDYNIFMPYPQLDLTEARKYKLMFRLKLLDVGEDKESVFGESRYFQFRYNCESGRGKNF